MRRALLTAVVDVHHSGLASGRGASSMLIMTSVLMGVVLFVPSASAQPQPTFVAVSVITSTASPGADMTVALPVGYLAYDIFIMQCMIRSVAETVTVSGWTAVTGSPFDRGSSARYWIFWNRATSASMTAPLWDTDGSTADEYCQIAAYRNAVSTGTPVDVVGTATTGTADPAPVTGMTTLVANALVVLALQGEDNNNNPGPGVATATDPANLVEHYTDSATGADAMTLFAEETRTTVGATGTVNYDFNVANPVGWGAKVLSLAPISSTSGHNSLVSATTSVESPGANCANGGYKQVISWGIDDNDDGSLAAGEIDGSITYYSCKGDKGDTGSQGPAGSNGLNSLVKITGTAPVQNCPNGGITVQSGLDSNGNGILDALEVQYTAYVCNGAPGAQGNPGTNGADGIAAIASVTAEPIGANCDQGGSRIDAGQDLNANGVLDQPAESYTHWYACNGPQGQQGDQGSSGGASLLAPLPDCKYDPFSNGWSCTDVQKYHGMAVLWITWQFDGGEVVKTEPNGHIRLSNPSGVFGWGQSNHVLNVTAIYLSGAVVQDVALIVSNNTLNTAILIFIIIFGLFVIYAFIASAKRRRLEESSVPKVEEETKE